MARPTEQAQSAINLLRAAGLKRGQYSVRTERNWRQQKGFKYVEYGDATIYVPRRTVMEHLDSLSTYLVVTVWTSKGKVVTTTLHEPRGDEKPRVEYIDTDEITRKANEALANIDRMTEKYGWSKEEMQ